MSPSFWLFATGSRAKSRPTSNRPWAESELVTTHRVAKRDDHDYTARVARPVDADSARTYDSIVAAGLVLLKSTSDPATLSLRKVAELAGLSAGTLHYYFPVKEDLLEACLDAYYERLGSVARELVALFASSGDSAALIDQAARRMYRFVEDERVLVSLRLTTNAMRQELHPRRLAFMGMMIDEAVRVLAPHAQLSPVEIRLTVHLLSNTFVRFALLVDEELVAVTGKSGDGARRQVEDFAANAAIRLLRPAAAS